jgi:predicted transcriptional regulator
MPYGVFIAAARRARYDVGILCARFRVSFEQAASRLTSMGRPDAQGIPFFTMEIDIAGNRIRRAGANGFPQAAFGGQCPKLNIHAAFAAPGQVLPEMVEMPGGARYLTIARTLEGPIAGVSERVRRTALLLACEQSYAGETAYADALPGGLPLAVGPACRLCERPGCLARAEPPVTRPLGLDEMVAGMSVFDFQ